MIFFYQSLENIREVNYITLTSNFGNFSKFQDVISDRPPKRGSLN